MHELTPASETILDSQNPILEIVFIFDGTDESDNISSLSNIIRNSDSITAANVTPIGINFQKYWNKLKDDKTNLGKVGIIRLNS